MSGGCDVCGKSCSIIDECDQLSDACGEGGSSWAVLCCCGRGQSNIPKPLLDCSADVGSGWGVAGYLLCEEKDCFGC